MGYLLSVGKVANSSVASLFYAFRIRSIEIWGPSGSTTAQAPFCSVDWLGAVYTGNNYVSDRGISSTQPAHLKTRPPAATSAGDWMNTDNALTLCTIIVQTSAVVDLEIDLIVNNGNNVQTNAVATATVGNVYAMALDMASGTHVLVPEAYATTF